MGVTLYVFDTHKQARRVLTNGIAELIHSEAEWMVQARIPTSVQAEPGEYLGFLCVDGAFRLFCIDTAEDSERDGLTSITATDAGVEELTGKVVRSAKTENVSAREAFAAILADTGWTLGTVTATERTGSVDVYYQTAWKAILDAQNTFDARLVVRYEMENNAITGRVLDVLAKESTFRGRIFDSARDAENIYTMKENAPVTVLYGIGKAVSTGDNPQKVTFADIVWSKAKGDPAEKPAGQDWISVPEALAKYGRREDVYANQYQDDPEKLLRETWEELQKRCKPSMTITANVQDMEMAEGYGHQQVRLWDTAAIVNRNGTALESTIINIDRDYVTPWLTKITLGNEEHASIARQMANQQNSLEQLSNRVGGHGAGIEENKEFIVKDRELIYLHTQQLAEQGTKLNEASITLNNAVITLEAHQLALDENGERISGAEIRLDGVEASIKLKADKTVTDELGKRVTQAEVDIDGANARINLKADQSVVDGLNSRVTQAEIDIDGANAQIALKASQAEVDEMGVEISSAVVRLDGIAAEIELKVSKNGVISAINVTTEEILIQARKINLSGYVTSAQLGAELADFQTTITTSIDTKILTCETAQITNVTLINRRCIWKSGSYVTSVTFPKYQEKTIYYKDQNGNNANMLVLTPTRLTNGSYAKSEDLPYLAYEVS